MNTPVAPTDYFWAHLPSWVWPIIVIGIAALFAFHAIQSFEGVAKAFGGLGRKIYDRKTQRAAKRAGLQQWELADLRRQLEFLSKSIEELRDRDEMTWAWILSDQEWHRNYEFLCAERGAVPMPRVSFMEFRTRWLRERTPDKTKTDPHGES